MSEKLLIAELQTKIKTLEQQLRAAEQIISQVPAHIYWLDTNFVFRGCNQAQADSAGLKSPKDVIGTKISDYLAPELFNILEANNIRALTEKRTIVAEEPGRGEMALR